MPTLNSSLISIEFVNTLGQFLDRIIYNSEIAAEIQLPLVGDFVIALGRRHKILERVFILREQKWLLECEKH